MSPVRVLDESGGSQKRKVFSLNEFEGHRYFELEEYYLHRQSGEWKKKKGVSINKDAYRILKGVIESKDEEIMDWLGVNYVPDNVERYEEAQAVATEVNRYRVGKIVVREYNEPRDASFVRVEHEGGRDEVSFNAAHPLRQRLRDMGPEVEELVCLFAQSFAKARKLLGGTPAIDSDSLLMHLEQDWGKFLRDALRDGTRG